MTARVERFPAFALSVAACALALAAPALINGVAFLYPDTAAYLFPGEEAARRLAPWLVGDAPPLVAETDLPPEAAPAGPPSAAAAPAAAAGGGDRPVLTGRSIYYAVPAYLAYARTGTWGMVALQALAVALPLVALLRAATVRWALLAPPLGLALAFATPAGVFVGLLMPDVWAGAMLLALAALVAAPGAGPALRLALWAIALYAALAHQSHVALLGALAALGAAWWLLARPLRPALGRALRPALAGAALGLSGAAAFSWAVERIYGGTLVSRPYVTAHLVDMGPGTAYARAACAAGAEYALCAYVDRLPVFWVGFLFDRDPATGVFAAAPDPVQRAIAAEQGRFALGTLRHDPAGTLAGLAADGVEQMWRVRFADLPRHLGGPEGRFRQFPADLAERTRDAPLVADRAVLRAVERAALATSALAAIGLAALALLPAGRRLAAPLPAPLRVALALLVAGVALNALVCGVLASPYDRFQARVVWLLPAALALAATALALGAPPFTRAARSPAAPQPGPTP